MDKERGLSEIIVLQLGWHFVHWRGLDLLQRLFDLMYESPETEGTDGQLFLIPVERALSLAAAGFGVV